VRSHLDQIVLNLVVNARDAMPDGGLIRIRTEQHEKLEDCACHGEGKGCARLIVEDSGMGMSKKVAEQIFEPFFTTKAEGQGSGLGLSTVYGIVKQLGGELTFDSEEGVGTRFILCLPIVDPEELPELEPRVESEGDISGKTILVVDSEPQIRRLTARVLEELAVTVIKAGSGEEALAIMDGRLQPVDLLVCDQRLPGMTGVELDASMRNKWPQSHTLFLSGDTDPDSLGHRGLNILSKPYDVIELLGLARELILKSSH